MKIACIQLTSAMGSEKKDRVGHALALLEQLPPVDLVMLPELWPVGYFQFDRYEHGAEALDGYTTAALRTFAIQRSCYVMGGSLVERSQDGQLHNTAFLIGPNGEIPLTYRKIHVFGYQSKEATLLTAGNSADVIDTPFGGIGLTTCYDLRFPELYRKLVDAGAKIILVPAAWPEARLGHWQLLTRTRALENQVYLAACNMAGSDDGTKLGGHSVIVNPWGEVMAEAGSDEEVISADLDMAYLETVRTDFPVLKNRRLTAGERFIP